jgi:hypothetical protein
MRSKPSVGGIPVREHLEINVAPFAVQITSRLGSVLFAFFFPDPKKGGGPPSQACMI